MCSRPFSLQRMGLLFLCKSRKHLGAFLDKGDKLMNFRRDLIPGAARIRFPSAGEDPLALGQVHPMAPLPLSDDGGKQDTALALWIPMALTSAH